MVLNSKMKRATYGKQIIATVSRQLQAWYGSKGFEIRNVRRMMQFAQQIKEEKIVSQLATKKRENCSSTTSHSGQTQNPLS
jgi:hypothetical protein